MFRSYKIQNKKNLNFSRWSRKAYAVFISIGKIIKISNLKIKVSQDFIKKNKTFSDIHFFPKNKNLSTDQESICTFEIIKPDILQLKSLYNNNVLNYYKKNYSLTLCKYIIVCVNFVYAFFIF